MIEDIYQKKIINIKKAIEYIFNTENKLHQAILITKLNESMYETNLVNEVRNYMIRKSIKIRKYKCSLDTCGTGGDGQKTLNISTTVALLLSSIGIKISKHGNRAASSLSGSTDILKELGFKINLTEREIYNNLKNNNFSYLNAPNFYPILKKVAEVRSNLGFKTFFNMIGPTLNPLGADYQIIGSFNEKSAKTIANILLINKSKNFKVFSSYDGMDEISIFAPTIIFEKNGKKIKRKIINHEKFKKYLTKKILSKADIKGKDAKFNAKKLINLFEGKKDSYYDIVVINAVYGLMTYNNKLSFDESYEMITNHLKNKKAFDHLSQMIS